MSFGRNLSNKYGLQLLDTATKTRLDALKNASKKLVYQTVQATGKLTGNTIADKIVKPKPVPDENSRNFGEVVVAPENREEILNELTHVLWNVAL